uniref:Uncharacterized protein n=1 Tax=Arundo donax TaxID=35708 RepID=A0A0A9BPJ9_ARUDO
MLKQRGLIVNMLYTIP